MDLFEQIQTLRFPAPLPKTLLSVEQTFQAPTVRDLPAEIEKALVEGELTAQMKEGDSVAVGVGSRGIANLARIVHLTIEQLHSAGMQPYIVPAMGSHGGATAEGQIEMLAELGVTEASAGCEIRATMDVAPIGQIENGPTLFQGQDSLAADHVILISRIKPHTDFRSHLESGPSKMAVIGLGKQQGASIMHAGGGRNFQRYLEPAARIYEAESNLRGAICLVENAREETAVVAGLSADQIGTEAEARLLKRAKDYLAQIPFQAVDVLVVREMGKEISGTGMDTNVIGRLKIPRQKEKFGNLDAAALVLLDITKASHGNAAGLGLANVTTTRVAKKVDWAATYTNAITSGIFGMWRVHLPITMANDQRALEVALRCCAVPPEEASLVLIKNTMMLDHIYVSTNLRDKVEANDNLRVIEEIPLAFQDGVMTSPWKMPAA